MGEFSPDDNSDADTGAVEMKQRRHRGQAALPRRARTRLLPSGRRIAFTRDDRDDEGAVEIYVMNANGSDQIRLTSGGRRSG
jgi:tricorn protease-like protein